MPAQNDFPVVFEELKKILKPYAGKFTVTADTSSAYSLDGPYSEKWKKVIYFGGAQVKKNYVSFYLMPVYMYPELLKDISPELKKHMQGKSCFNFKKVEPDLFKELEALTLKGSEKINKGEWIMSGQEISFDVNGQAARGYLATPSNTPAPGVIVLHAWWGLNQFFKVLCDRLAAEGFVAFAPDLNDGRVATTVDEAKQLMSELSFERKKAIADGMVDTLRARPEVQKGPLSLIGFSMGAAWSLALVEERPEEIGKAVLFYGVGEADFTKVKADILGHFSDSDEWEPLDGIRAMEEDMHSAGLEPVFHIYPKAQHWFFEQDRPEFDPQAAELAWRRTLDFLRK